MVADGHRRGVLVVRGADPDRLALAVLDRVPIRLRRIRSIRRESTCARQGSGMSSWTSQPLRSNRVSWFSSTRATMSRRSTSSRSSAAAPASNRLISSRSASSSSNRLSSFCSSSTERLVIGSNSSRVSCSRSAAIRTVVSGVRSSCETSETKRRCNRDSSSSRRICCCRLLAILLKETAEPGQVVGPPDLHPLLEPAAEPLRDPPGHPDRGDHLPGDQPGDRAQQHHK